MNFKKLLKGPLPIVLVAIVLIAVGISLFSPAGFKEITTDRVLSYSRHRKSRK